MLATVSYILEDFDRLLARTGTYKRNAFFDDALRLPLNSGAEEIAAKAIEELASAKSRSHIHRLCMVIRVNASDEQKSFWIGQPDTCCVEEGDWLDIGSRTGAINNVAPKDILEHVSASAPETSLIHLAEPQFIEALLKDHFLSSRTPLLPFYSSEFSQGFKASKVLYGLYMLYNSINILPRNRYHRIPTTLKHASLGYTGIDIDSIKLDPVAGVPESHPWRPLVHLWEDSQDLIGLSSELWLETGGPLVSFIELFEKHLGPSLPLYKLGLASLQAGIQDHHESSEADSGVLQFGAEAYASRRKPTWWKSQLSGDHDPERSAYLISLCLTFGSVTVLTQCADEIEAGYMGLDERLKSWICCNFSNDFAYVRNSYGVSLSLQAIQAFAGHPLLCALILSRISQKSAAALIRLAEMKASDLDKCASTLVASSSYALAQRGELTWMEVICLLRNYGGECIQGGGFRFVHGLTETMSVDEARQVLQDASQYPYELVAAADDLLQADIQSQIKPVSIDAEAQSWLKCNLNFK
ncbi:MAG: hypothetical protein EOP04_18335 [Proteobacteria bacterium]|nr:MAG: hypothetical protein EOP04_18335 [Pseudomonadota bacterium]